MGSDACGRRGWAGARCAQCAARPAAKLDARYIAAARELRDRYLEQINSPGAALDALLARAKYNLARPIAQAAPSAGKIGGPKRLPEAA